MSSKDMNIPFWHLVLKTVGTVDRPTRLNTLGDVGVYSSGDTRSKIAP